MTLILCLLNDVIYLCVTLHVRTKVHENNVSNNISNGFQSLIRTFEERFLKQITIKFIASQFHKIVTVCS